MLAAYFRHRDGVLPNLIALSYTFAAYFGGIALLFAGHVVSWAGGVLLLTHAMILSAYFIHELTHGTILKSAVANERLGTVLSWLNGSCYASFADLRKKHMRHHVDRADVIAFDHKRFLQQAPAWLRRSVLALEWLHIPAVELIMHGFVMVVPFISDRYRDKRLRVIAMLLVRALFFAALAWMSVWSLVGYSLSWLLCLTVLRFADAYQHTYDAFASLDGSSIPNDKSRDRLYEQDNTYSNLVSVRYPWLNLLLLNFSYHNAHHQKPVEPWYRLPALHIQLYGSRYEQVLPMRKLLAGYHRHRITRILSEDYGEVGTGAHKADGFYGAVGVSFLTAI